ncbi:MAG: hypothetical protein PVI30_17270 [Myxococcales bacterium]
MSSEPAEALAPGAAQEDDNGVDLAQVDMMLSLTPKERLDMLFETASSLARLMPDADPDPVL